MENASKALTMAGGVLISIMILGALVIMWNKLSTLGSDNLNSTRSEQVAKFNEEYLAYDRQNLRGSDLLSVINKVLDYNASKADVEGIQYQRIELSINLGSANVFGGRVFKSATYTQDNIGTAINNLRNYEVTYTLNTMTALSSYANSLPNPNSLSSDEQQELKALVKKLTGDENKISVDEILDYAEYSEFKRASFTCEEVKYNSGTGRIVKMVFEKK